VRSYQEPEAVRAGLAYRRALIYLGGTILKNILGKAILSFVLIVGPIASIFVDWNQSHLFNPTWPPHAKFHDWAMLNHLTGTCALALWLLWRKSSEPQVAVKVATLIPLIFWFAFFYTTTLLPDSSLNAFPGEHWPVVAGFTIYPNEVGAFLFSVIGLVGYRVAMADLKKAG
jgi:hypothetical protein